MNSNSLQLNTRKNGTHIFRYSLRVIFEAENKKVITANKKSSIVYYVNSQNNFQIFSDQDTIIGVKFSEYSNTLALENLNQTYKEFLITRNKKQHHQKEIQTISISENEQKLIAGDSLGGIFIYNINLYMKRISLHFVYRERGPWIGSSSIIGPVGIVGGTNEFSIVNLYFNQIIFSLNKTAVGWIWDTVTFRDLKGRSFLALTGSYPKD